MDRDALAQRITERFETLPAQLGEAARYVLENPDDVALLSMREQARRAGVQPWTMTRLAKRLGFDGYDRIRELHAEAIRQGGLEFSGRADQQLRLQSETGDRTMAREMVAAAARNVDRLAEPQALDALVAAAEALAGARRVFCLGLRSSHAAAAQFAYVMSFLGEKAVLVGGDGRTGMDTIRFAAPHDALLATSVAPYTRATVEVARHAAARGVPVVAVTDSAVSPLAAIARHVVVVATASPSFFHSMTPAFLVGEILAALVAGRDGPAALAAITDAERQLSAFGVHLQAPSRNRP